MAERGRKIEIRRGEGRIGQNRGGGKAMGDKKRG